MKLTAQQLKVYIDAQAKEKISHYVALAQGEVSGLGLVSEVRDDEGNLTGFMVDDIYLLKQRSAAATTELDDSAVAALLTEIDERGEDIGAVRLWWHSHGDLAVFWSSTDEECAQGLANSRYFVSIVVNKAGNIKCRIDIYSPIRLVLDDVPVETLMPDFGLLEQCTAEFKQKVTETEPLLVCHGAFGCDCQPYEYLTEEQVKELNELEDKMERGLITYGEFCESYFSMTGEKPAPITLIDSGLIN
jgi:hypothetical protein